MTKVRVSVLVTFFLALSGSEATCAAQMQFPDTPAGHQGADWLVAFNTGNRETYRDFLQRNFPSRVERVDQEMGFREMTGGLELRRVEESTPTKVVALVQERLSDQVARLTLEIEAAEPHHIANLDLRAIPRPAEFPLPHMSESDLTQAIRKKLEEDAAADRFAGSALVAKNGKPVFAQAYGLADREHKVPDTLKTRFRIGSMNKMFTATAALQLAQAGKLRLDDPLGKYLTDYPNKDIATKVTIKQLLTHTGGTGDIFGPEFEAHRLELRTLRDYVKLYGNRGLQFEPGSRWEYSNYGFVLLGLVIEKASGEDYYDYVRKHIHEPAGMTSTGSEPEDQPVVDRSVGYTKMSGTSQWHPSTSQWHPNTDTLPYRGTSAGGGYSTVEDLLRFANALQGHKLLNADYTELLTTGKVDTPRGRYGYGFEDQIINGTRCFGHGGGAPGMNGDLEICPGPGYVIAVLANIDPPAAARESDFITSRLPVNALSPPPAGRFLAPKSGEQVTQVFTVEGSLSAIPSGHHVWVAVQIGDLLWPKTEVPAQTQHWTRPIHEGGAPGESFSLALLMVDATANDQILAWLDNGQRTGDYPGISRVFGSVQLDAVRDLVVK
jgi:D-alanyl-D-alanine carboxypeptidase